MWSERFKMEERYAGGGEELQTDHGVGDLGLIPVSANRYVLTPKIAGNILTSRRDGFSFTLAKSSMG